MALTNSDILQLSEPLEKMYMDCTAQLLINLCKHFAKDKEMASAEWEAKKLSELGALTEESINIIAANTGATPDAIKEAIAKGLNKELSELEEMLSKAAAAGVIQGVTTSWQSSEAVKAILKNLTDQALNDANIVNTVMLDSTRQRYINAVQFAAAEEVALIEKLQGAKGFAALGKQLGKVQRALNASTMSVTVGAEARTAALRRTVKQLAAEGITGFIDAGGHQWSPEAYINMDIRTTVHNAAIQGQKARSADYGVFTFQISSHSGARPLCAPYQGKFYSWDGSNGVVKDLNGKKYSYKGIQTTSYGQPAGIFGINCGHRPNTFISGYNLARFEPTENASENNKQYLLAQKQRYIERQIRRAKTEALCYDAAGLKDDFSKAAAAVKEKNALYKDFCSTNRLQERTDRTQVFGYNRSLSAKATATTRNNTDK